MKKEIPDNFSPAEKPGSFGSITGFGYEKANSIRGDFLITRIDPNLASLIFPKNSNIFSHFVKEIFIDLVGADGKLDTNIFLHYSFLSSHYGEDIW